MGTSRRPGGGGVGGGGVGGDTEAASSQGMKTDDDEDLRRRRKGRRRKRSDNENGGNIVQVYHHPGDISDGGATDEEGIRLLRRQQRHLLQDRQVDDDANATVPGVITASVGTVVESTSSLSSGVEGSVSTGAPTSEVDQVVLSSTTPPEPTTTAASSGHPNTPKFNTLAFGTNSTISTVSASAPQPETTVTSFIVPITVSVTSSGNSTVTQTFTSSASRSTIDATVFVYTHSSNATTITSSSTTSPTTTLSTRSSRPTTSLTLSTSGLPPAAADPSPTTDTLPTSPTSPLTPTAPEIPKIVGGVLGGIAGIALLLVAILFLLRRHKRAAAIQARDDAGYGGPAMSHHRSSLTPLAAATSFITRHSRHSRAPSDPPSERGFYKVSGRKIAPVLGGPPPMPSPRAEEPSEGGFYMEEDGRWVGGPNATAWPSRPVIVPPLPEEPEGGGTPLGRGTPQEHRGSPAPSLQTGTPSGYRGSPAPSLRPGLGGLAGRDVIGRSHASHDGSRTSRFTEDIV